MIDKSKKVFKAEIQLINGEWHTYRIMAIALHRAESILYAYLDKHEMKHQAEHIVKLDETVPQVKGERLYNESNELLMEIQIVNFKRVEKYFG